jgi:GxxExxY protein
MRRKSADGLFHDLTEEIIRAGIEVHRAVGPGLLESTYEECLHWELQTAGVRVGRQVMVPLVYKGRDLGPVYRLDLLVENRVIVEIKAVDRLATIHQAQMLTYLRHTGLRVGLIFNFNTPVLRDGIKRVSL